MRHLAIVLGVFAVFLRCVIAPGLMPDMSAAAQGTFKLVICTGDGAKMLPGAPGDNTKPHQGDTGLCPFSALAFLATPASSIAPTPQVFLPVLSALAARDLAQPAPIRTPGARAPPRLS